MRKLFLSIIVIAAVSVAANAQLPSFARTTGDGILHGYVDVETQPGLGILKSSVTLNYGIGKYYETGLGISSNGIDSQLSLKFRTGKKFSRHFSIGGQYSPYFSTGSQPAYTKSVLGLYIDGYINDAWYWTSNTICAIPKGMKASYDQWTYIGVDFNIGNDWIFSPSVGVIHSWLFDRPAEPAFGFYWMKKSWVFYLWSHNIHNDKHCISVAVEFRL